MSVLKTYGADTWSYKPSTTYQLKDNRIVGMIDGLEAVKQSVYLILNIERFEHFIYSWDYGNELSQFLGKPREYIKGDIERQITESLLEDDRIEGITNFTLSFNGECALISFTVRSIFGDFEMERSVEIGR